MLDIDHFKRVNDDRGHDVGDAVIKEFGKRLSQVVNESGMVARLGGDEFVILIPNVDAADQAIVYAENIQHAMTDVFKVGDETFPVATSIGIAVSFMTRTPVKAILKTADEALYEAKDAGRSTFRLLEMTTKINS
jgi:diguanylate cyclase (GGDEF)-like protein